MNCWVIIHYLSVSCKQINHSCFALLIWSPLQLSTKKWIITQQFTARADLFLKWSKGFWQNLHMHWYWDCSAPIFVNSLQSYGPWMTSEICFRSISWERRNGFWPNLAYSSSSVGLLSVNFRHFDTELWPLNDVRISFPLNILSMKKWIVTKFCRYFGISNV